MVVFAELQMQGDKHVHVNSGLLKILQKSFDKKRIDVFCDERHKIELSNYIENTDFYNFTNFKYTGEAELKKSAVLKKTVRETLLAYKIFKYAKKEKVELVVFASAFPFTSILLNFFSLLFSQKTIICLHGDIGVLSLKRKKLTTTIYRNVIKFFFLTRPAKVVLLFYGKTIEEKLFNKFPNFNNRNTISIDHPYNYDTKEISDQFIQKSNVITIANIGTGLMNKNSHLFYKLAEKQRLNVENGKVKFIQIGNVSQEVLSYSNKFVEIINNNTFIPFDLFEKEVNKADFFIYFFKEDSLYDLCPSGTFFDALKYKKPIISLRNPFFEFYFKKLGNIGYLCDTVEEMSETINQIIQDNSEKYDDQVLSLNRATKLLSNENIQKEFMDQYKRLNI
ncbi:hypothetical protein SAMN06265349_105309 [Flavobacterium resistens]|uniref:Uncharacterized protein n=1 Tax=Flavobacterium resistens TaxID=443612 RepID=A0A521EU61_9FLAO|nr:glycosyltransferase family 4 protein [Flavobacterium resistens]MRX67933.1 hypothetical protein [Flavobacterium resistens]SMO86650.1 hypothetical protein SAMN06265349_105309 [Flavobacterium resistens]